MMAKLLKLFISPCISILGSSSVTKGLEKLKTGEMF